LQSRRKQQELNRQAIKVKKFQALFFSLGTIAGPTFAKKIAGNHLMYRSDGKYTFKTYRTPKSLVLSLMRSSPAT
jgi:hypothetical protein